MISCAVSIAATLFISCNSTKRVVVEPEQIKKPIVYRQTVRQTKRSAKSTKLLGVACHRIDTPQKDGLQKKPLDDRSATLIFD